MPGKTNDLLNQTDLFQLQQVRYHQPDAQGNVWWVDIVGRADAASASFEFAQSRAVFVEARPITPEQARELVAGWGARRAERRRNPERPPEKQPADEPNKAERQTGFVPYKATISLDQLAITTRPFLVSFEIDPRLTPDDPIFEVDFNLSGNDTTVSVFCDPPATNGTIDLEIESRGFSDADGPGTAPQVFIEGVPKHSGWHITVTRSSGLPVFTLKGSKVVN